MLRFVDVEEVVDVRPAGRFGIPKPNAEFRWHRWAEGPEYLLCVARVVQVINGDKIKCRFFNPATGGEIDDGPHALDLALQSDVWRDFPSTIGDPTTIKPGVDDCAILCLSPRYIRENAKQLDKIFADNPGLRVKYPAGESGLDPLVKTIGDLAGELRKRGGDPGSIDSYKQALHALPPDSYARVA